MEVTETEKPIYAVGSGRKNEIKAWEGYKIISEIMEITINRSGGLKDKREDK